MRALYGYWMVISCEIYILKIFSSFYFFFLFCGLAFYSQNSVLWYQKVLNFDEIQFTYFFFLSFCLALSFSVLCTLIWGLAIIFIFQLLAFVLVAIKICNPPCICMVTFFYTILFRRIKGRWWEIDYARPDRAILINEDNSGE